LLIRGRLGVISLVTSTSLLWDLLIRRITSEGDVERLEELVHSGQQTLGSSGIRLDCGFALEDNDSVGKVGSHDLYVRHHPCDWDRETHEIVLDDKGGPLGAHDKLLDDLARVDTLLRVKVCRGLVNEQNIGGDTKHKTDGDSLQLSSRQSSRSQPGFYLD
jgi:hypothetical protein